jgi:hypothetical protein
MAGGVVDVAAGSADAQASCDFALTEAISMKGLALLADSRAVAGRPCGLPC